MSQTHSKSAKDHGITALPSKRDELVVLHEGIVGGTSESWRTPATAADAATELIRRAIFTGTLRPGDQVPVDDVVEVLRISRLPVREAMTRLKHEGLLRVEAHRGSFVGPFDAGIVREHWDLLGILHGHAARRIAAGGDVGAIDQLSKLADEVMYARIGSDVERYVFEFRRLMNLLGGTERLRSVMRSLISFVPGFLFRSVPNFAEVSIRGTSGVMDSIKAEDAQAAEESCRRWAADEGASVIALLTSNGVFEDLEEAGQ